MALVFCDSFDHYGNSPTEVGRKWNSVSSASILSTSGRRSTQAVQVGGTTTLTKAVSNLSTIIFGFAANPQAFVGAGYSAWWGFYESGSAQCSIGHGDDGSVRVFRGLNVAELGRTPAGLLTVGAYCYIEVKITFGNSGSIEVRVNGVTQLVVSGSPSVDTTVTSNNWCDQVRAATTFTFHCDDLYICDTSGAVNNDFLGDVRIDCIMPNAAGTYNDFTGHGGSPANQNHDNVAEADSDEDTTYNESSTAGHRDSYHHSDLSALVNESIKAIVTNVTAKKDDAGARSLKTGIISSSASPTAIDLDAGTGLSTSYQQLRRTFETDPATGAAWTLAGVNGVQSVVENV